MIKKYTTTAFFAVLLIGQFFALDFVYAQGGYEFFTSWKADNYAPGWYAGKVLPSRGSRVTVSFELLSNGKAVNLSKTAVRWYVDRNLVRNEDNGLGIQTYSFAVTSYPGNNAEIKISLPDYSLDKIIEIPVVNPEVIIEPPGGSLNNISRISIFKVNPFFFNVRSVKNLSFQWTSNGQSTENLAGANILNFGVAPEVNSGSEITLKVLIRNLLDEMQFATKEIKFKLQ